MMRGSSISSVTPVGCAIGSRRSLRSARSTEITSLFSVVAPHHDVAATAAQGAGAAIGDVKPAQGCSRHRR